MVIPGGRAPEYLAINPSVVDLAKKFSDSRKPIAVVCHGLLVLAAANAVKGRRCTGYKTLKHPVVAAGAIWVEPKTIADWLVDDNLITAASYEGHPEYLRFFVKALGGSISGSGKKILFLCGVRPFFNFVFN